MMYIVRFKDGRRWKVREAVSLKAVMEAISMARVSGSIGSKSMHTKAKIGLPISEWPSILIADVVQINSDGTERQPYTEAY